MEAKVPPTIVLLGSPEPIVAEQPPELPKRFGQAIHYISQVLDVLLMPLNLILRLFNLSLQLLILFLDLLVGDPVCHLYTIQHIKNKFPRFVT